MSINIPTDQIPLGELDVLIVDVQTSGATPPKAQVIELAWGFVRAHAWDEVSAPTQGLHAELIKLRSKRLPRRVEEITGIRTSMLRDAPDEVDVWGRLLGTLPNVEPTITVAHYARFETKFLHHLHETHTPQHPFPFDILCTHAIARRLFPNLPRYGLRALAGYLGHHTPAVKRALDHAAATAYVWSHLVEHLEEHDIHTLHDLICRTQHLGGVLWGHTVLHRCCV